MSGSSQVNARLQGVAAASAAYVMWGFMPLYWRLVSGADSWEVIAHRVMWSLVFLPLILAYRSRLGEALRVLRSWLTQPRLMGGLVVAALFCGFNWWINVIAVQIDHVVELGIGTFLTPLLSVLMGVICFRERLGWGQWLGMALAAVGVLIMVVGFGQMPWIALSVSLSWAAYGAMKKRLQLDAWVSLLMEGLLMLPLALGYVVWLQSVGAAHFLPFTYPGLSAALAGTGLVASIPMVFFTMAAVMLPMNLLGLCQYIAPFITLLLGVLFFAEPFGCKQALPWSFIWTGIAVYLMSDWVAHRHERKGERLK